MRGLSKKGSRSRPKPAMNVTPLVDVVLVLLIIFMVVLPALDDAIQLEVPTIVNVDAETDERVEPYVLSIRETGEMYLDEMRLPADAFEAALREANAAAPDKRLVMRGDRNVRYGEVRKLFRVCQRVGFPGVSLRVSQEPTDTAGARARR